MILNKYKFVLGLFFYIGSQCITYAQNIDFQGAISEFTCAHESRDPLCQNLQLALSDIKKMNGNKNKGSFQQKNQSSNNQVATISEQKIAQNHKIIILSYH